MLLLSRVSVGRERYFTSGPPGRWWGQAAATLGCAGPVDPDALRSLLRGLDPATHIRLAGLGRARSRAGYELVLAAPKSVSLLATLGGDGRAVLLSRAHDAAVADALAYLEASAPVARQAGRLHVSQGWAVATFTHRRNAAGEPHLHTHAVVANLAATPDGWRCLATRQLSEHLRAADARYFVAFDSYLRAHGLNFEWDRTSGRTPDIAGVPRAAVLAASSRRAEVIALAPGASRDRELVRRVTHDRRPDAPWPAAVTAAGFDRRQARALLDRAAVAGPPAPGHLDQRQVDDDLLARGSRFTRPDALASVGAAAPPGATLEVVEQWTTEVCARARPVGDRQFLSPYAAQRDARVAAAALDRRSCGAGVAATTRHLAERTVPLDPVGLDTLARLANDGHGVEVLAAGISAPGVAPIMAQAAVLDAARVAWQASGHRVALLSAPRDQARWRALTGLDPPRTAGAPPTVIIVDRADRLATPELGALLDHAARQATKVILLEGGSVPPRGRPRSDVLPRLMAGGGALPPGQAPAVESVRHPPLREGDRLVTLSGSDAVGLCFAAWAEAPVPAMMLAGGLAEVDALNAAARRHLAAAGVLRGSELVLGGLALREGERVLTLTRGAGALGTVVALDRTGARVRWDTGLESTLDGRSARRVGHGYAATPALVRPGRANPSVFLGLGGAEGLGDHPQLAQTCEVAPTGPRWPTPGDRLGHAARLLEAPQARAEPAKLAEPWAVDRAPGALERERLALSRQLQASAPLGDHVSAWTQAQRDDLVRWVDLGSAIDARRDLESAARTLAPTRGAELVPDRSRGPGGQRQPEPERDRRVDLGIGL